MQVVDLDGDGRLDLVVTTYIHGTMLTHVYETRVYQQQSNGSFMLKAKIPYPAEVAAVVAPDGTGAGAFNIVAGDIDGDGKPDIAIAFENMNAPGSWMQMLHNDGNWAFTDQTLAWIGKYQMQFAQTGPTTQPIIIFAFKLVDLNNDGKLDLQLVTNMFHNTLATWSPFWLNDGTGKLSPWLPLICGKRFLGQSQIDPSWKDLLKITSTRNTDLLAFDATGDGLVDWVFLDAIDADVFINGMHTETAAFVRVLPQLPK